MSLEKRVNTAVPMFLACSLASCSFGDSSELAGLIDRCRTGYQKQTSSLYVLPYRSASTYHVGQGNCTDGSHERGTDQAYAYDFDMPIGTELVASREGRVLVVVEHFAENNGVAGQENYLILQHQDDQISGYYHLTFNGAAVAVGDWVEQGDVIGYSGNTGYSSEPHLHFEVARCEDCKTLPIVFSNTRSHSDGLLEGEYYLAQ